jgi:ketosteroid isomerase-like protein
MPERAPEVEWFVREWLDAKQAGNGAGIGAALSDYDGVLAIGTEAAEWWSGAGEFAARHTAGGPFAATIDHVEAHRQGAVAWAAVRAVIETGEAGGFGVRLTLVLMRDDEGSWKLVQSHASAADDA